MPRGEPWPCHLQDECGQLCSGRPHTDVSSACFWVCRGQLSWHGLRVVRAAAAPPPPRAGTHPPHEGSAPPAAPCSPPGQRPSPDVLALGQGHIHPPSQTQDAAHAQARWLWCLFCRKYLGRGRRPSVKCLSHQEMPRTGSHWGPPWGRWHRKLTTTDEVLGCGGGRRSWVQRGARGHCSDASLSLR